jgi:hypothetical protein
MIKILGYPKWHLLKPQVIESTSRRSAFWAILALGNPFFRQTASVGVGENETFAADSYRDRGPKWHH